MVFFMLNKKTTLHKGKNRKTTFIFWCDLNMASCDHELDSCQPRVTTRSQRRLRLRAYEAARARRAPRYGTIQYCTRHGA
jgi:hypothetical protein